MALDPTAALLVIDLGTRTLLDGDSGVLASLDSVRIHLRVVWPGGSNVVYRGDPLLRGCLLPKEGL